MADTTNNLDITTTPQSVSSLGGPAAGVAVRIVNIGPHDIRYAIAATIPDRNDAFRPMKATGYGSVIEFASGEDEIWLWTSINKATVNVELA